LLLCYVTDRRQLSPDPREAESRLLERIADAIASAIDFIQIREKDLGARDLLELTSHIVQMRDTAESRTRILVNSRIDVAIASHADGVQLRADDIPASEARAIFLSSAMTSVTIGVSCHSVAEVASAESHGADFGILGPVFSKNGALAEAGLELLADACQTRRAASPPMPVLAIGGIDAQNAAECLAAGAAGVAAIRLFQDSEWMKKILAQRDAAQRATT
jgi:thiamine-phosphate pyrophosphorylase